MSTDRIERRIEIQADLKRVWDLISEPGWWINDGAIRPHTVEIDGDLATVRDPQHGTFLIRVVRLDPPRYAAFRWLSTGSPDSPDGPGEHSELGELGELGEQKSTLVEFWLDQHTDNSVTLRVAESGFASLDVTEQKRLAQVEDDTEGWELELAAARTAVQQP